MSSVRRPSPSKRAPSHPQRRHDSIVVDRVITALDAAVADRAHSAEVVEAVRKWLASHGGTSPAVRSPARTADSGRHADPTSAAASRPGMPRHHKSVAASILSASSRSNTAAGAKHSGSAREGESASAGAASSSSVVSSSWVRLFASQATNAMRTLSSLSSLQRIRIECLANLQDLTEQASQELASATMNPEHPFVRSSVSVVPVVAYQLKAGALPTTKPALKVIIGIAKALGSYLAPVAATTVKSLLDVWGMAQHITVQGDIYTAIEAVAGTATDAAPIVRALTSFHEDSAAAGHSSSSSSRLPGLENQRRLAAKLAMQLLAATVHMHPSVLRLRAVIHGHRVSEETITAPFGTSIQDVRIAVARSPAAGDGVDAEDVVLVNPLEPLSKAAAADDVTDLEGGLLLTLAAHPFAAGDSALPSRPPSPGAEPSSMLIPSNASKLLTPVRRVQGPPVLTIQEPTPKRPDGGSSNESSPLAVQESAADLASPRCLESTARADSVGASPPTITETPRPAQQQQQEQADNGVSPPTPPDERNGGINSPDARSPQQEGGDTEMLTLTDAAMAAERPFSGGIEGRLSVSVTGLWRMFLSSLSQAEQEQIFPCLYVLFPYDVSELFLSKTVPNAPVSSTSTGRPTAATSSSGYSGAASPKPLNEVARLGIWRALHRGATPVVITTPLYVEASPPCVAGTLHFLVPRGGGSSGSVMSGRRSSVTRSRRAGSVVSYSAPVAGGSFRSITGGSRPPSPGRDGHSPLNGSSTGRPPLAPSMMVSPADSPRHRSNSAAAVPGSGGGLSSGGPSTGGSSRQVQMSQLTRRRSRTVVSSDMQDMVGDGGFVRDEWREQATMSPIPMGKPTLSRNQSNASMAAESTGRRRGTTVTIMSQPGPSA